MGQPTITSSTKISRANQPFTGTPRPRNRRNDYGFTLGGPVWIPKVYKGKDKTFFFFNWEQFREALTINTQQGDGPDCGLRNGQLCCDAIPTNAPAIGTLYPGGPSIFQGEIFDPTSTATAPNGTVYRTPFANNTIPSSRFDPVAVKIQNLFPASTNNSTLNNFIPSIPTTRHTEIPSVKIDQAIGDRGRLSFFWHRTQTTAPTLGNVRTGRRPAGPALQRIWETFQTAPLYRLNYDYTRVSHHAAALRRGLSVHLLLFVPTVNEEGQVPITTLRLRSA